MLSPIFDAFLEASPISVMMRVLMENIFNSSRMNQLFKTESVRQYEQELLFSTIVDLMSLVVCGMYPSVHAAAQKKAVEISVSATALYNKLQRIELPVSRALVHETASDLQQLLESLNVEPPSPKGQRISAADYRWQLFGGYRAPTISAAPSCSQTITRKNYRHCSTARKLKQYKATLDAIP
ncbi:MAG: hypothetical protein V7L05_23645 [Nostoc sp.]|uniref:hypothetical protein n=1 Tax=Nostoc sp. TaxID=1180 RepID=UPI002FFC8E4A